MLHGLAQPAYPLTWPLLAPPLLFLAFSFLCHSPVSLLQSAPPSQLNEHLFSFQDAVHLLLSLHHLISHWMLKEVWNPDFLTSSHWWALEFITLSEQPCGSNLLLSGQDFHWLQLVVEFSSFLLHLELSY